MMGLTMWLGRFGVELDDELAEVGLDGSGSPSSPASR